MKRIIYITFKIKINITFGKIFSTNSNIIIYILYKIYYYNIIHLNKQLNWLPLLFNII